MNLPHQTDTGSFGHIFSGTAYIDPNDFGDVGYVFLPVALPAFPKLLVYSPYPDAYDKAISATASATGDRSSVPIGLTWRQFESLAAQGALWVVGRTGYLNRPIIRGRCDRSFLDSVQILETQRWEANAETALSIYNIHEPCARSAYVPPRYASVLQRKVEFKSLFDSVTPCMTRLPLTWKEKWKEKWKELADHERLLLVACGSPEVEGHRQAVLLKAPPSSLA